MVIDHKFDSVFDGHLPDFEYPSIEEDITFGISINTYYKKNGETFAHLSKTIESVLNQTYQNWIIFLVGDKYENQEEFEKICQMIPENKRVCLNLENAVERDLYLNKATNSQGNLILPDAHHFWHVAGSNACNVALDLMEKKNVYYWMNLNHDDIFLPYHLYHLYKAYKTFPEVGFVFTCSHYTYNNGITQTLPSGKDASNVSFSINNLQPQPCNTVHSSVSYDTRKYKIRYPEFKDDRFVFFDLDPYIPSTACDLFLWENFLKLQSDDFKFFYIPTPSVSKENGESVYNLDELVGAK